LTGFKLIKLVNPIQVN